MSFDPENIPPIQLLTPEETIRLMSDMVSAVEALHARLASAEAVVEAATLHTHQCDSDADGKTDLCDAIEAHRARYPREATRKGGG